MTTLPASWLIPYTLNTFHREVPGGGACGCGMWEDDLMECIVTTGPARSGGPTRDPAEGGRVGRLGRRWWPPHVCLWRPHCRSPTCPWVRCVGCGRKRRWPGANEKRWAWRQPGGFGHRQARAGRPAASSTALNTRFRGWPDSLGLGNTTSQTGNPGWLINRDFNATPTAGGRPALVEASVLAVPGRGG